MSFSLRSMWAHIYLSVWCVCAIWAWLFHSLSLVYLLFRFRVFSTVACVSAECARKWVFIMAFRMPLFVISLSTWFSFSVLVSQFIWLFVYVWMRAFYFISFLLLVGTLLYNHYARRVLDVSIINIFHFQLYEFSFLFSSRREFVLVLIEWFTWSNVCMCTYENILLLGDLKFKLTDK